MKGTFRIPETFNLDIKVEAISLVHSLKKGNS